MMLSATYVLAALSIYGAALYLIYRLRLRLTTSSFLLAFLLVVHGPAYLVYMLFRGGGSIIYERIAHEANFESVVVSLNVSIALMFVCIIIGIEAVDRLMPAGAKQLCLGLSNWNDQRLESGGRRPWLLLTVITLTAAFMAVVSLKEHHLSVIRGYLAVAGDEFEKIAYRQKFGGSQSYAYRVLLASIAPMLIVWAGFSAWIQRWWPLLIAAGVLLALTLVGKLDTLSKAPAALFIIQLLLVAYLARRNDVTWRVGFAALVVVSLVFYPIIRVAVPETQGFDAFGFLYYRIFDNSNEAVLEFFATFPYRMPHSWGANIRPLAFLLGKEYAPSYFEVLRLWHGAGGSSVTGMFIADAWVDFSYFGVILFSTLAGATCRAIDTVFLARGKTVVSLAVLGSAFIGAYNLTISALPAAFLSGGLVTAPLIAVAILKLQHLLEGRSQVASVAPQPARGELG
ncbi:signal transduction histidine kinase [Bradyrhizobium sp. USDA 4463]